MGCSERVDVGEKRWWNWNGNDREAVVVEREWWQCGDMCRMCSGEVEDSEVQARQVAGRCEVGLGGFGWLMEVGQLEECGWILD